MGNKTWDWESFINVNMKYYLGESVLNSPILNFHFKKVSVPYLLFKHIEYFRKKFNLQYRTLL